MLSVVTLLGAMPAPSKAAQVATSWRGANVHSLWWAETPAQMHQGLDAVKRAGANVVRIDVAWATLDSAGPGKLTTWYSTKLHDFMAYANQLNIKVVALLFTTPCWASSAPASLKQSCNGDWWGRGVGWYPPNNPQDFADFARYITSTYGASLAAVEIWNEPDQSAYLTSSDPVSAYAALLKAAYPAAKAGNSSVPVLAGSLAGTDLGFLQGLYQAGIQGYYDGIAVHPYCGNNAPDWAGDSDPRFEFEAGLQALHAFQTQHGDTTPVWVTEFGWNTVANTTGEQAAFIQQGYQILAGMPYVQAGIVYEVRDDPGGSATDPEANFGMLDQTYAPKPAYAAFTAVMTTPAAPVLTAPASGAVVNAPTPTLSFTAAPNSTVAVSVDGTLATSAQTDGAGTGSATLAPLADGQHSVTLVDTDSYGNVGPASSSAGFTVGPAAPSVVAPQNGTQTSTESSLSFNAPPGTTLNAYVDGVAVGTAPVDGGGHAQVSLGRPLADGSHSLYATVTDGAGLTSPASTTSNFTVLPPAPVILSPRNGASTASATTVQVTGVAGDVAKICVTGRSCANATFSAQGRATISLTGLSPGSHTVRALETDHQGLSSGWTATTAWTVKPQGRGTAAGPTATAASVAARLQLGVRTRPLGRGALQVVCRVAGTTIRRCAVVIYRQGHKVGSATATVRHGSRAVLALRVRLSPSARSQHSAHGSFVTVKVSAVASNGLALSRTNRGRLRL